MQSPRARAATQRNGAAVPPGRPSPAAALGGRTATASCQSSAAACFSRMMPGQCPDVGRRHADPGRRPGPAVIQLHSDPHRRGGQDRPPSGQSVPQPTQLAFQLRGGGIHHPGVEAHARHHHEGVTTGPADVDRPHSSADRRPQIGRDPKVTNEQVAGAPRQHRQRITAAGRRRRTHPRRADRRRQSPGRPLELAPPWFGRSPGLAASSPASGFGGISARENLFHYCVKQPGLRHQRCRS